MEKLLRIAICEDKDAETQNLTEMIETSGYPVSVISYPAGEALLRDFEPDMFNLIFLDIYMHGMNGIETARAIRRIDSKCGLVFITNSPDFALEGFEVDAMQYLLKPAEPEKIHQLIVKCAELIKHLGEEPTCSVRVDGTVEDLPLADIMYVDIYNKSCIIHLPDSTVQAAETINEMEQRLPSPPFYRCHRSYIVNLDYVREIDRDFFMKNGDVVYIRRGDVKAMKEAYMKYLIDLTRRKSYQED